MEKLNLNHVIFVSVFLLLNQTTTLAMQHNKSTQQPNKQKNSQNSINKIIIGGTTLKQERRPNLEERLAHRFLTELPKIRTKEPVQNIPTNNINLPEAPASDFNHTLTMHTHYHTNDDCYLEWSARNTPLF